MGVDGPLRLPDVPLGASITWVVELGESEDFLFPAERYPRRVSRSSSHVFLATTVSTGKDTFQVEYAIQLDVGGIPGWFRFADGYFRSGLVEEGDLVRRLEVLRGEKDGAEGGETTEADRGEGQGVEGVADDGEGDAKARTARLVAAAPLSAPPPATRTAA